MCTTVFKYFIKFGVLHAIERNKWIYNNYKHLKCQYLNFGFAHMIEFFMMLISY